MDFAEKTDRFKYNLKQNNWDLAVHKENSLQEMLSDVGLRRDRCEASTYFIENFSGLIFKAIVKTERATMCVVLRRCHLSNQLTSGAGGFVSNILA